MATIRQTCRRTKGHQFRYAKADTGQRGRTHVSSSERVKMPTWPAREDKGPVPKVSHCKAAIVPRSGLWTRSSSVLPGFALKTITPGLKCCHSDNYDVSRSGSLISISHGCLHRTDSARQREGRRRQEPGVSSSRSLGLPQTAEGSAETQ